MVIKIVIKDKVVSLLLLEGKSLRDQLIFRENQNISDELLPSLDKIFKRNDLRPKDIKSVAVSTNLGECYTSRRIAETVAKTFNWVIKSK